jgi:uncharacterized protein
MSVSSPARLHVVDALRGFAIISILLLHNIEHFDFYFTPQNLPTWMVTLDKGIWDTLFFMFGGKSYAIFALLFGLTFFIQFNNQAQKGKDFRGRFAWRMVLLVVFGFINSCFFEGDILFIYAIIGFSLIPVAKLSNKAVLITAIVLILQPYEWYNFVVGLFHPQTVMANPVSWQYFGKMGEYIPGESFWATVYGNLTNGKIGVLNWTWENGRVFQTAALFMLGMLAGRKKVFVLSNDSKLFWFKVLMFATIAFIPFYITKNGLGHWISSEAVRRPLITIFTSWSNLSFMLILVACFVLLFQQLSNSKRSINLFTPFGRMSLTNYIMQSILGSCIYYGFGLGLYKYTGASYSILIGVALAIFQWAFCYLWLAKHKQGPLESLWHKATWFHSK